MHAYACMCVCMFTCIQITYKKEKTGRAACNQPGGASLLDRLLRVDDRGVCASRCGDSGHYTLSGGTNVDNRHSFLSHFKVGA